MDLLLGYACQCPSNFAGESSFAPLLVGTNKKGKICNLEVTQVTMKVSPLHADL